jgi:hypothetical protein
VRNIGIPSLFRVGVELALREYRKLFEASRFPVAQIASSNYEGRADSPAQLGVVRESDMEIKHVILECVIDPAFLLWSRRNMFASIVSFSTMPSNSSKNCRFASTCALYTWASRSESSPSYKWGAVSCAQDHE